MTEIQTAAASRSWARCSRRRRVRRRPGSSSRSPGADTTLVRPRGHHGHEPADRQPGCATGVSARGTAPRWTRHLATGGYQQLRQEQLIDGGPADFEERPRPGGAPASATWPPGPPLHAAGRSPFPQEGGFHRRRTPMTRISASPCHSRRRSRDAHGRARPPPRQTQDTVRRTYTPRRPYLGPYRRHRARRPRDPRRDGRLVAGRVRHGLAGFGLSSRNDHVLHLTAVGGEHADYIPGPRRRPRRDPAPGNRRRGGRNVPGRRQLPVGRDRTLTSLLLPSIPAAG